MVRGIDRLKEEDYYIMVPKKESGFVSHFADLIGVRNIHPPTRIEILPYVVGKNKITNKIKKVNPFYDASQVKGNIGGSRKLEAQNVLQNPGLEYFFQNLYCDNFNGGNQRS